MSLYKVVACPKCRTLPFAIQVTTAEKTFKCLICGKTTKMDLMRIFYKSDYPDKARIVCSELKLKPSLRRSMGLI